MDRKCLCFGRLGASRAAAALFLSLGVLLFVVGVDEADTRGGAAVLALCAVQGFALVVLGVGTGLASFVRHPRVYAVLIRLNAMYVLFLLTSIVGLAVGVIVWAALCYRQCDNVTVPCQCSHAFTGLGLSAAGGFVVLQTALLSLDTAREMAGILSGRGSDLVAEQMREDDEAAVFEPMPVVGSSEA